MFKRNIHNKRKNRSRKNNGIHRARIIVFICIIGMMLLTGYRAFTLNENLDIANSDSNILRRNVDKYSENMIENIIISNSKLAHYANKANADKLEKELVKKHGAEKIFDVLVRHNYDPEVYDTLYESMNRYFKSPDLSYGNMIMLGTEEGVFFLESSAYREKFDTIKNNKEMVSWEEFYEGMPNSEVVREVCEGMKKKRFDSVPVIMRLDGEYKDNRMYTPQDLADIYKKEGVKGLRGFGFFSLATITDTGDMFGNKDNNFMLENEGVHKVYVFRYTDINQFVAEPLKELTESNVDATVDIDRIEMSRKEDISVTLVLLGFNVIQIIGLMVAFKSLDYDEEDDDDENDKVE